MQWCHGWPLLGLNFADLGERRLAQLVGFEQAAKLQPRGGVRHALVAQVDAHEAAQRRVVQQNVLPGLFDQVAPVLNEMHAQHARQAEVRPAAARLGVLRLDQASLRRPGNQGFHPRREPVRTRGLTELPVPSVVVHGYANGRLPHA
jgi:hypothetical protein